MEVFAAAAGDHVDGGGIAPVLRGVGGHQHTNFGHRVHRRHAVHGSVRARVEIAHAVDRHVLLVVPSAQNIYVLDAGGAGRIAAVTGVDDTGHEADRVGIGGQSGARRHQRRIERQRQRAQHRAIERGAERRQHALGPRHERNGSARQRDRCRGGDRLSTILHPATRSANTRARRCGRESRR